MSLLQRFRQQLESLSLNLTLSNYVVAYSGGLDSHVLLHLCKRADIPVRAVHIHHGLQTEADDWSKHCEAVCNELDLPFKNIHVNAAAATGESPENAARNARYAALQAELEENEVLLTAHHMDDQSETLLLQLLRGAGPAGLAAMPVVREKNDMLLVRPLLGFSRSELFDYAKQQALNWVEDPSNADTDYDRNLLRQDIVPAIKQRWPKLDNSLMQVASQQQDVLEIIEAMAAIDLAAISSKQPGVVSIKGLKKRSRARQLNVLRYWIRSYAEDAPTSNVLNQLCEHVLTATDDAEPVVSWGYSEIRRYQNKLYLLRQYNEHDITESYDWQPDDVLEIKSLGISIFASDVESGGLSQKLKQSPLTVRFRQGGEKICPANRKYNHSLKKLMQEAGIPPWQRSRIPLLYLDDQLVYVTDYWIASEFAVSSGETGWTVSINKE